VLAALVPERVLPFASGDARKRGPGPSRALRLGVTLLWSAERRAGLFPIRPCRAGRAARAARQSVCGVCANSSADADSVWMRLSALRFPAKGRIAFLAAALSKTRMRTHRENESAIVARPQGEKTFAPWRTQLSGPLDAGRVAAHAPLAASLPNLSRAKRSPRILPLLRGQKLPPGAHMSRRRSGGVPEAALAAQEGSA
jgi:hypothetical protein